MSADMIKRLENLVIDNPLFAQVEASFDLFCPFEAMGVVGHEIRHSNFLAYYLDPARPHGLGSECLKAVMRAVAKAYRGWDAAKDGPAITPLDFHLMDFDQVKIEREWRNIDLLVVLPGPKLVIAFELKINAREHGNQLERYTQAVSEHYPADEGWGEILVYLTKHGGETENHRDAWLPLGLNEVAQELDRVAAEAGGGDHAREYLSSYLAMLRRHHLPNARLDDLAAKLWSQHREALEFLMERSPQVGGGIFGRLYDARKTLAQSLATTAGITVVPDECARSIIRFAVPSWDSYPGMLTAKGWTSSKRLLLIELSANTQRSSIAIKFVIGQVDPADQPARQPIYNALESAALKPARGALKPSWTHIAVTPIANNLNETDDDPEAVYDRILAAITRFGEKIAAADQALKSAFGA
ncbi:PD-(D/E)XK nuclease family protein [Novosphingobium humi]|uniref:PD-(D/E)XK nuclease family protein n=1 Tax=Novosphingobium humi TaxID=2282397 RepID=A0ABY7U4J2_9SPHN|nr:PD-(D/E)XK nuclease family protein [Novosphingobium humi]WCT80241.1 PD-(D/E)XK nuclease family protein [Novosphingobium humi]